MIRFSLAIAVFGVLACLCFSDLRAESTTPAPVVFALIVTSNHGASGTQPDLHYADDDGVKYLELFQMLAGPANVFLHTELDRDTQRLYPFAQRALRSPTKGAVASSIMDIAERVARVRREGGVAEFYFVFAGHGDVEAGVGFLELLDARFTSQDVEAMLRGVAATRSHVILDSCNSFFVVTARKPGGRKVVTAADVARSFAERLPTVGVFLSTSSEAQVFEWSELQAGIFSHAVRSGLAGAADANGDGDVSYQELRAFVEVATMRVKNPLYRPKVFARGPEANAAAVLVRLSSAHATTVSIGEERVRLTLRDADGIPLVDLHKEDGASLLLRFPDRWAAHSTIEHVDAGAPGRILQSHSLEAPAKDRTLALADLTPSVPSVDPRGARDIFRLLFTVPFGKKAMASALPELAKEEEAAVYGVSNDDIERMRILLAQAANDGQGRRVAFGTSFLMFGALLGATGGWLATAESFHDKGYSTVLFGYAILGVGNGAINLFGSSAEEKIHMAYSASLVNAQIEQRARALALAEHNLYAVRHGLHNRRLWMRATSFVLAGAGAGMVVLNELDAMQRYVNWDDLWGRRLVAGSVFAVGTTLAISSFIPYPAERLADVWASDPVRVRTPQGGLQPAVSFAPTRGGGELHFGLTF